MHSLQEERQKTNRYIFNMSGGVLYYDKKKKKGKVKGIESKKVLF